MCISSPTAPSFTKCLQDSTRGFAQVDGRAELYLGGAVTPLAEGDAIAVRSDVETAQLELRSDGDAHYVLLQGQPIGERIVQRGPFVMNTREELAAVEAAYAADELGSIEV